MVSVKTILIWSSGVCPKKTGEIVSRKIRRVSACSVSMLKIRMTGAENIGTTSYPNLCGKWPLK